MSALPTNQCLCPPHTHVPDTPTRTIKPPIHLYAHPPPKWLVRYWRGQHSAAARAAQTVLRELVVLRGHLGGLAAAGGLAATGAAGPPVPPANVTQELAEQVLPALPDAGASSTPQGSRESVRPQTSAQSAGQPAGCSAALLDEMAELRAAAADAEARAAALAQARERAEESEGLASMQAAALLGERAVLIRDLGAHVHSVVTLCVVVEKIRLGCIWHLP